MSNTKLHNRSTRKTSAARPVDTSPAAILRRVSKLHDKAIEQAQYFQDLIRALENKVVAAGKIDPWWEGPEGVPANLIAILFFNAELVISRMRDTELLLPPTGRRKKYPPLQLATKK